MTFFGDGYDGLACGSCNVPPSAATFLGGWWGLSVWPGGAYLTRLPDVATDTDWLEVQTDPLSTSPNRRRLVWRVYHETDSVRVDDIQDGGQTWRCVGVASSAYANGSGMKGPKPSVVWYQLHFAPLNDLTTATPRAGFAVVRVTDTSSAAQESDPYNHECTLLDAWLLEEGQVWDSADKLAHYHSVGQTCRRTVVGPEYFAYETRVRTVGADNTLTYYGIGDATPTVKTWTNPEVTSTEITSWTAAIFCRQSFPMGIATTVEIESTHGDGTIETAKRLVRLGMINLGTMLLDTSDVETHAGTTTAGDGNVGATVGKIGDCTLSRTVDGPSVTLRALDTYYADMVTHLRHRRPIDNPVNPADPIYLFRYYSTYPADPFEFPPSEGSSYGWACVAVYNQRDNDNLGNNGINGITVSSTIDLPDFATIGGWFEGDNFIYPGDGTYGTDWETREDISNVSGPSRAWAAGHNTYGSMKGITTGNGLEVAGTSHIFGLAAGAIGRSAIDTPTSTLQLVATPFERWSGATGDQQSEIVAVTNSGAIIEAEPPAGGYLTGDLWNQIAYDSDLGAVSSEAGVSAYMLHFGGEYWMPPHLNLSPAEPVPPPTGWIAGESGREYGTVLAYDQSADDLHPGSANIPAP